jgi:hypothetical protein
LAIALNHLQKCAGIILPVMRRLRIELFPAESGRLFGAPAGHGELFRAGARIQASQKRIVLRRDRAKGKHGGSSAPPLDDN